MTPIDLARGLARSERLEDQALGVGMLARGLSDDVPGTMRQGWPLSTAIEEAINYLGLMPTPELIEAATDLAPNISDAMLNYRHERE